jgi:hypothetical protein
MGRVCIVPTGAVGLFFGAAWLSPTRPAHAQVLPPLRGDFSLNAANVLSARHLLALGLERLTPTHDLNAAQLQVYRMSHFVLRSSSKMGVERALKSHV